MKTLLCLALFLLSSYSYALVVGKIKVRGVVVKYNKHTITLQQKKRKVTVPRQAILTKQKLRTGKKIYVLLQPEDLNNILVKPPR